LSKLAYDLRGEFENNNGYTLSLATLKNSEEIENSPGESTAG
jgi:hypothetical protein